MATKVFSPQKQPDPIEGNLGTIGSVVGGFFGPVGSAVGGAIGGEAAKQEAQANQTNQIERSGKLDAAQRELDKQNAKSLLKSGREQLESLDPETKETLAPVLDQALQKAEESERLRLQRRQQRMA